MASILVTHGAHFLRDRMGRVYAADGVAGYAFWRHYLKVFERVGVAARVGRVDPPDPTMPEADGPGVEFRDLPDFLGPWQYVLYRPVLAVRLREFLRSYDACCLRVSCPIGTLAWRELCRQQRPFGVEVISDPWAALARGSVRSIVRPIARRTAVRALRSQCLTAAAAAYVTRETLQRRYPPAADAFTTYYSDVELPPDAVVNAPRTDFGGVCRLLFVGSLQVLSKGPDVLIRAVARLERANLRLRLIGDGRSRCRLERLAADLGVSDRVTFSGAVPAGEAVRAALDASDLFVLPSRTEGLPRALIEAMARGLPCIGTKVGGVPELLTDDDLVPPGHVDALAAKIVEFIDDPERMRAAARRNLEQSREYLSDRLTARRSAFYAELRRICCGAG